MILSMSIIIIIIIYVYDKYEPGETSQAVIMVMLLPTAAMA